MRLLNTETLELEEFFAPPSYAIVSHRWSHDEVSYEQYQAYRAREASLDRVQTLHELAGQHASNGLSKIIRLTDFAAGRGHRYVWIDTCCIDKRSSAELTEAINSMWDWYAHAKECVALLSDIHHVRREEEDAPPNEVAHSEWFTRGWTLQELLAPRVVIFVDGWWRVIGHKHDLEMAARIAYSTGIPSTCLLSQFALQSACVAQKLSWAANRKTTRVEDMAYSLLGLLGVNMPLLYGEGSRAFQRLQLEIIRQSDDESIFAWRHVSPPPGLETGVLATSVDLFANSGSVRRVPGVRAPYAITNKGLQLRSDLISIPSKRIDLIQLNCVYGPDYFEPAICLIAVLRKDDGSVYRVGTSRLREHLEHMYAGNATEVRKDVELYVRTFFWHPELLSALALLRRSMRAYVQRSPRIEEPPRSDMDIAKLMMQRAEEEAQAVEDGFERSAREAGRLAHASAQA